MLLPALIVFMDIKKNFVILPLKIRLLYVVGFRNIVEHKTHKNAESDTLIEIDYN